MNSSHKCGGKCCQRFMIGEITKEEIETSYHLWLASGNTSNKGLRKLGGRPKDTLGGSQCYTSVFADIHLVYPMLIDLGVHNWEPWNPKVKTDRQFQHWGCKHFDKKTSLCTIYEIRPQMCRSYPGIGGCLFEGCKTPGAKDARERELKALADRKKSMTTRGLKKKIMEDIAELKDLNHKAVKRKK